MLSFILCSSWLIFTGAALADQCNRAQVVELENCIYSNYLAENEKIDICTSKLVKINYNNSISIEKYARFTSIFCSVSGHHAMLQIRRCLEKL